MLGRYEATQRLPVSAPQFRGSTDSHQQFDPPVGPGQVLSPLPAGHQIEQIPHVGVSVLSYVMGGLGLTYLYYCVAA